MLLHEQWVRVAHKTYGCSLRGVTGTRNLNGSQNPEKTGPALIPGLARVMDMIMGISEKSPSKFRIAKASKVQDSDFDSKGVLLKICQGKS